MKPSLKDAFSKISAVLLVLFIAYDLLHADEFTGIHYLKIVFALGLIFYHFIDTKKQTV